MRLLLLSSSLHPFRAPFGGIVWFWPIFNLVFDQSISDSMKRDCCRSQSAVCYVHLRYDFRAIFKNSRDVEPPESASWVICIQRGKVGPAFDNFRRLRPNATIVFRKPPTCCDEIVGRHGRPECLDDLFACFHSYPALNTIPNKSRGSSGSAIISS